MENPSASLCDPTQLSRRSRHKAHVCTIMYNRRTPPHLFLSLPFFYFLSSLACTITFKEDVDVVLTGYWQKSADCRCATSAVVWHAISQGRLHSSLTAMQFRRVDYTSIIVVITISSSLTAMQFRQIDYTVVSQHYVPASTTSLPQFQ